MADYDLNMDEELIRISAPDTVETYGLGPCLGIAFYQPNTKTGYMAHLTAPAHDSNVYDIVNLVLADLGVEDLKVTLAGLCTLTPSCGVDLEMCLEARSFNIDLKFQLHQYLLDKGISESDISEQYAKIPGSTSTLLLDAEDGSVYVEEEDFIPNFDTGDFDF
ncbi:MAG: hypothetical protein ABIF40_00320 [archaeon]